MNQLITEDERKQLLEHGRVLAAGLAMTRCPWCGCSRQMRTPPGC